MPNGSNSTCCEPEWKDASMPRPTSDGYFRKVKDRFCEISASIKRYSQVETCYSEEAGLLQQVCFQGFLTNPVKPFQNKPFLLRLKSPNEDKYASRGQFGACSIRAGVELTENLKATGHQYPIQAFIEVPSSVFEPLAASAARMIDAGPSLHLAIKLSGETLPALHTGALGAPTPLEDLDISEDKGYGVDAGHAITWFQFGSTNVIIGCDD